MERDPQLWDARAAALTSWSNRGRTASGTAADDMLCEPRNPSSAQDGPPVRAALYSDRSQATRKGQKSLAIRDGSGLYSSSPAAIATPA